MKNSPCKYGLFAEIISPIRAVIYALFFFPLFTDHKTSLQEGTVPDYSWAPKYAQPQSEPPDYQHNVYIPGTTSDYSTLKLAPRGELDVYNSFSTFGKKKKFISHYEQSFDGDDALISNAIFK